MINRWLIWKHLNFTSKTFPKGTAKGAAIHAGREIEEVIEEITDMERHDLVTEEQDNRLVEEYADVFGCLIDSVHRSGISRTQLNKAFAKKLSKNKARTWKDNGDGSYSHVKTKEM